MQTFIEEVMVVKMMLKQKNRDNTIASAIVGVNRDNTTMF